ncbi:MAG: hypothetical protein ACOC0H_00530 [Thermodesulfobacteriota bacterium]
MHRYLKHLSSDTEGAYVLAKRADRHHHNIVASPVKGIGEIRSFFHFFQEIGIILPDIGTAARIDESSKDELLKPTVDFFHRIVVHYALWFTEVRHQMGMDKALEILDATSAKSLGSGLRPAQHRAHLFR